MAGNNRKLGSQGEAFAVNFLESNGCRILETNFRTKFCEIDIIAMDNDTLCFIEVKTRSSLKKGLPKEAVTPAKQKKIIQGASFYLKASGQNNVRVRFDVMEVYTDSQTDIPPAITLIKNAFGAY